jgi:hypothetical protein
MISRWKQRYKKDGVLGLATIHPCQPPPKLTPELRAKLVTFFRNRRLNEVANGLRPSATGVRVVIFSGPVTFPWPQSSVCPKAILVVSPEQTAKGILIPIYKDKNRAIRSDAVIVNAGRSHFTL